MIPELADIRLFVALPVYGGYHQHFVPCLLDLVQRPPCPLKVYHNAGDSLVSRSRNRLVKDFLDSDATHLLFLDTDLIFSPEQIGRLLSHRLPFVAGLYPKKQKELAWVMNTLPAFGGPDPATGLQRVMYAGTGCMVIAREIFEKLAALFPEIQYDGDAGEAAGPYYDFFRVGVHVSAQKRRYLSEDWFFCHMMNQAGMPVMMDTHVVLKHCGEAIYPLENLFSPPVPCEPAKVVVPGLEDDPEVERVTNGDGTYYYVRRGHSSAPPKTKAKTKRRSQKKPTSKPRKK